MSDQKKSPSDAYADWLTKEADEAPPLDEDAVDPDEDDGDDIDDEESDDSEEESESEPTDSAPGGASKAQAQAEATSPPDEGQKEIPMNKGEIRVGLTKLAADENAPEEDRNAAKRALAAMDESPEKKEDPAPEPKSEEESAPDPDDDEEEPKDTPPEATDDQDEDDKTKPDAASALALAAEVQALSAWKSKTEKHEERARLMASRPDFAEATVKWLGGQKIDVVRTACRAPSKGGLPFGNGKGGQIAAARAAAANAAPPTAGERQPQGRPGGSVTGGTNYSGEGDRMDQLMGLTRSLPAVETIQDAGGTVVVMRATKRAEAARQLAARNGVK